jgi:hypothetical protein
VDCSSADCTVDLLLSGCCCFFDPVCVHSWRLDDTEKIHFGKMPQYRRNPSESQQFCRIVLWQVSMGILYLSSQFIKVQNWAYWTPSIMLQLMKLQTLTYGQHLCPLLLILCLLANFFMLWTLIGIVIVHDRLCGLVVRVPGYWTEMYCASCEVRTEFIYVM